MKVLFFVSDFSIGISALLTDQLLALHNAEIPILAIGGRSEQEPGLIDKIKAADINLKLIDGFDNHTSFKAKASEISNIIKDEHISIVHVQNNWQLALCAYCKFVLSCKIKIIYTLHGFRHNNPIKAKIAQVLIGFALVLFANRVICMCKYLKSKFCLLSHKIVLLPLGIPDTFFKESNFHISTSPIKGVFAAQFREGKNQDIIIKAFAKYIEKTEDRQSIIYLPGSGPLLHEMQELVKKLGIDNQIKFPGQLTKDEVLRLYNECNIAIVSSNSETFGQCIVEPFVLGKCIITRPVGIAPDIISNGKNGFLFNNTEDLTKILITLHKKPKLIKEFGQQCFSNRERFNWTNITKEYLNLLKNISR